MADTMTRRTFLKTGSLIVAVTTLEGQLGIFQPTGASADMGGNFKPHAFVEIAEDNSVTVWLGQTNLGQGTHTGIAMIVADELDADWKNVTARMALAGEPFKDPYWHAQLTGGSTSIRHRWEMLRSAGATARQMLLQAAAQKWGVDVGLCKTDKGRVLHPDGRSLTYGELVAAARKLEVPANPPLKGPEEYRIIGTSRQRLDIPDKVQGKAIYGIDFSVPGMCIAVVARPPRFGARPLSYDEDAALSVKGVLKVVSLENRVAVCATSTYAAMQGREKLNIKWSEGSHPGLDDDAIDLALQEHLAKEGAVAQETGDTPAALAQADTVLEAAYKVPYVAHAALEPINCTAHVEKDRCRVWIPTQGQTGVQHTAAAISGVPLEKVEVMTTLAGGGFGLRGETDPVKDAVSLSKEMKRPVKVIWTREDDFANDYFRPASVCTITGGLDKEGNIVGWSQKVASPSVMSRLMADQVKDGVDPTSVQGITDMVYTLPNRRVEYVLVDLPIPVGFWRSVGYSITTFTVETFIDELAAAAGKDPVAFRLAMMEKDSRPYRTLALLADKSGWGSKVPEGRGRGIAVGSCFGSSAAHMAEVSVDRKSGRVTVHKLVCAVDCGPAIYPDAITAQMEGAGIMALSLALHEKIHFSGGGVRTANFDEYQLLTISEVPDFEVYISESKDAIGGIGEPGVPTVAPAVANAIHAVTGVRLKEMPFRQEDLKSS